MFLIINNTESFMNPEYSVNQSCDMTHPYKQAIADVLSGKISLVQLALAITNSGGPQDVV